MKIKTFFQIKKNQIYNFFTLHKVKLYLTTGQTLIGKHKEGEYEIIYDSWLNESGTMIFENCEVKTSEVVAIQWD